MARFCKRMHKWAPATASIHKIAAQAGPHQLNQP